MTTDLSVSQSCYDVAQCGEGEVDVGALLQAVPRGPGAVRPLAARQVHDVDQGSFLHFFPRLVFGLLGELDAHNGVGPGGGGVHVGAGDGSVDVALLHPLTDVLICGHDHLL